MLLDRDTVYKEIGSGSGTIDKTLQHILAAQTYWCDILVQGVFKEFDRTLKVHAIAEVVDDLLNSSQQLVNNLSLLDDEKLIERIEVTDSTQSRYEYILHLVNHGSYHRGQVVTIARALGVVGEIPVTDYDAYLWWIENKL